MTDRTEPALPRRSWHGGTMERCASSARSPIASGKFQITSSRSRLPAQAQARPSIVLYVEDELFIRMHTADALREAGLTVLEAISGVEAQHILAHTAPIDLLLTDIQIPPGPNGLELARHLRTEAPRTPIVVVSAYGVTEDDMHIIDAYLLKPYDVHLLVSQVGELLKAHFGSG